VVSTRSLRSTARDRLPSAASASTSVPRNAEVVLLGYATSESTAESGLSYFVVRSVGPGQCHTAANSCPPKMRSRSRMRKPGRRVVREGLDNLLRRPSRGRGVGHVEMYDSAAVMEEDYEHVEHVEHRRGHDEEVDRDKIGDVILEEGPPGL
jgi:hypothetical protein